ncbi:hypothetical protein Pla8534_28460 [Lignipirellula cremea]|uniref:Uncharacterized protein n=1 Tax=Lignipirellula cremea TaxID=2528010 RepID=A0A518DT58_9BACT|nr:hypothetical protein Pla8534_28460 [Lignipirellula cremea]
MFINTLFLLLMSGGVVAFGAIASTLCLHGPRRDPFTL